jgi:putative endonuclease
MEEKRPCVYLLASGRRGTLYGVHDLVWFEVHASMESAIAREKALKFWKRAWKLKLVEESNPEWRDLYADIC